MTVTGPWPAPSGPPRPGHRGGPPVGVTYAAPPPLAVAPVDRRPWWGLGDVVLGGALAVLAAVLGNVAGLFVVAAPSEILDRLDELATAPAVLAIGLLAQQAVQGGWPILVARWKGFGVVRDFRWAFRWRDLLIGPIAAAVAVGLSGLAGNTVADLLRVSDEDATNTEILTDFEGKAWFWVFVFAVSVGAPLAEELFFRGLTLRAFQKRWGLTAALVGSTVVFTLPHYSGGGWAAAAVIFTAIGIVGLVLGVLVIQTGRLGPAIVAHVVFNSFTVLVLIADDSAALGLVGALRGVWPPVLS